MIPERLAKLMRMDSWVNTLTGLGLTTRDKMVSTQPATEYIIDDETLDVLYHSDDLAERICSARWDEMMRQGFDVAIKDKEASESQDLVDALEDMDVSAVVAEAGVWGQLFGGAVVLLGADDGQKDAATPLNESAIKSFDWLQVLDRRWIYPHTFYDEPMKPGYGSPKTYQITPYTAMTAATETMREVHESRLVRFPGVRTSVTRQLVNNGWDYSIMQRVWAVLQQTAYAWQSSIHLLGDASQAVFTVKGLMDKIAGGQKAALQTRFELVEMCRSVLRAILVDEGESFKREPTPFNGIPDMLDRAMQRLSAAARMPLTVLFGISPAGLNATGASDIRLWYDSVKSDQFLYAKPRLERIAYLKALAMKMVKPGGKVRVTFPSLYQLDPKESAELRLTQAKTDAIYLGTPTPVVTSGEIGLSRFKTSGWSEGTTIDIAAREKMQAGEVEALDQGKQAAKDKELEDKVRSRREADQPAPAEADAPPEAKDPTTALNGAQMMALLQIITNVAEGIIPRGSGVELIAAGYPFTTEQAEKIMGEVGTPAFEPAEPEPKPSPFGGGPPPSEDSPPPGVTGDEPPGGEGDQPPQPPEEDEGGSPGGEPTEEDEDGTPGD